jgi:hypothetical protein
MTMLTLLVKSEKYMKNCLAGVDENKKWIRPIKPEGFDVEDIIMDNHRTMDLFDVVNIDFSGPIPIGHHIENMKLVSGSKIRFIKARDESKQIALLKEITDAQLLTRVESKFELYDEIVKIGKSIAVAGPIDLFEIQYNCGNHPKIWVTGKNNSNFYVRCTDINFNKFVKGKFTDLPNDAKIINSQEVAELRNKPIFFVIGLTGDSLEENNKIKSGKYTPDKDSIEPRYWPMVVSILTVPNYS